MTPGRIVLQLWLWELPQTALGWLLLMALRARRQVYGIERLADGRQLVEGPGLGVSLGAYVYWSRRDPFGAPFEVELLRAHELGHTVQSRRLGPLYLPTVGVLSSSRALYSLWLWRRTGASWPRYFDAWPEDQADRYGGIVRDERQRRVLRGPALVVTPPVPDATCR